ncbi:hypothetical protein RJT34_09152 [Clitoria ternatea]|uniref:Cation/H+ exchanger transmembrane domain-containing protein n=1 Tax=Clitoria ternatea TaxID=43366 RepID=A0AAN9K6K5_CLITE
MPIPRGNGTVSVFIDSNKLWHVCVKSDRGAGSFGIFFGDRPFDFVLPITLCQIIVFILISRALYFLLRPLKTPKFVCNVLGGIVLGPSCLGRNEAYWKALFPANQAEYLILSALVGASYFVFFMSLKMDVLITVRAAKSTWRLGIIPFLASFVAMSVSMNLFYHPQNFGSIDINLVRSLISVVMSFSHLPVVSDVLIEINLLATELGQIALSSSMINDIILWFLILSLHMVRLKDLDSCFRYFMGFLLFLASSIFILGPTVRWIVRTTPVGKPVKEIYVVLILLGVLAMTLVSDVLGLSFVVGPVMLGLVIPSGAPLGTTIVEKSEFIISEFLLPFFFVFIGMNTSLEALRDWRMFLTLQGIFIVGNLVKMLASVLVGLNYRIRPRHATVLGLMLNFKGITELIVAARFRKLGVLNGDLFSQLVYCVLISTAIVTPIVQFLYKHRPRVLQEAGFYEGRFRTIHGTPENKEFRVICCINNEGSVRGFTNLLEACNPMLESPICAYVIHLIEL